MKLKLHFYIQLLFKIHFTPVNNIEEHSRFDQKRMYVVV
jgi:hypothetical protein